MNHEAATGWIREVVLDCPEPIGWRVYRDPAGHAFCLVVR
jgi:hypothetical protein